MVIRTLIDALNFKAPTLASFWKDAVKKCEQLKHYNALDAEQLIEMNSKFYPILARFLERGMEKSSVGGFFVSLGKDRMKMEFPVSEVILSMQLSQKIVIEYLMTECVLDNSMHLYQVVDVMTKLSEFYLLGSYYVTKGFLEETYLELNEKQSFSAEVLKRYFPDDFFFK